MRPAAAGRRSTRLGNLGSSQQPVSRDRAQHSPSRRDFPASRQRSGRGPEGAASQPNPGRGPDDEPGLPRSVRGRLSGHGVSGQSLPQTRVDPAAGNNSSDHPLRQFARPDDDGLDDGEGDDINESPRLRGPQNADLLPGAEVDHGLPPSPLSSYLHLQIV
jgi:hypothetical protein